MNLQVKILEGEVDIPKDAERIRVEQLELLKAYFNGLPEPIKEVIRRVILVDSLLMGYPIDDFKGVFSLYSHKNTFSEEMANRLCQKGFPGYGYGDQVSNLIGKIRQDTEATFLEEVEDVAIRDGVIAFKAEIGFNRFLMYSGDPNLYLFDCTLTGSSRLGGIEELKELLVQLGGIKLFSDK